MRRCTFLACAGLLVLSACGDHGTRTADATSAQASDRTRSFPIQGFTAVELAGPDSAEIRTGGDFAVNASGDPEVLERLEVTRSGDALKIGRKRGGNWSLGGSDAAKLVVTMPAIRSATLSGSGDLTIDRAQGDFHASLAGSGDLTVGALDGGTARLHVAGSGTISAAGTVAMLEGDVAGSGDLEARQLKASGAKVRVAGSGEVRADVSGAADVAILGSGGAALGPNARCTRTGSGSGRVDCGQSL